MSFLPVSDEDKGFAVVGGAMYLAAVGAITHVVLICWGLWHLSAIVPSGWLAGGVVFVVAVLAALFLDKGKTHQDGWGEE